MKNIRPTTPHEFQRENSEGFSKVPIQIFLCGKGLPRKKKSRKRSSNSSSDLRIYLRSRLRKEVKRCEVWLGEHISLIRAYRRGLGGPGNLADYEFALALRKDTDLVILFPSGPGSFAEIGMFCRNKPIALKMVVFVDRKLRGRRGFLMAGPYEAARIRRAQIRYVNYADKEDIWKSVHSLVLEEKEKKRARELDVD